MLDTSLNSPNFYFLLAVFQGAMIAALLTLTRQRVKPNIFIAILILLFSSSLLHSVLESSIHAFNSKFPIPMDFGFAYGPLAFFHILHIKNPLRKFSLRDAAHFFPTLLLDVVVYTSFFLYVGSNMDWAYGNITFIQTTALCMSSLGTIQFSIYTYIIYKESRDTQLLLKDFKHVSKWISVLVTSWIVIIGFLMIAIPTALFFIELLDENSSLLYNSVNALIACWILVIGYAYLLKYAALTETYIDKVQKFSFSFNELGEKKRQLLDALDQDELYKDSKITIAKLAGHLGWPINSASKLINETLETNFNDLVNRYRVTAFKEICLIPNNRKYSILGLGQSVGFSSKASFYRVFKKETGMTPKEYMKSGEQRS